MKVALIILSSSVIIAGVEILKRKYSLPTFLTRRITHIGTAIVAGIAPLFVTRNELVIVCMIFAVVLLLGRRSGLFSAIHSVERHTFGEVYLPLGVAATALLFLPQNLLAFQFGIFIMGISDALAGLVGEVFGKHSVTIFGNRKTLEGSVAFFISSLLLTILFNPLWGYQLVLFPLVLTIVEILLVFGLDNLLLPVVAAYLIQIFI